MNVITFNPDGTAHCLWTETIDLSAIGSLQVTRASTIEFNNYSKQWEVRNTKNELLYSHPSRKACLDWENQYFNR